MNYIEIILEDIKKKYLDEIIREVRKPDDADIISSHFFDKKSDKDIAFQDIGNFSDFFEIVGTGNLFLRAMAIGIEIEKVFHRNLPGQVTTRCAAAGRRQDIAMRKNCRQGRITANSVSTLK